MRVHTSHLTPHTSHLTVQYSIAISYIPKELMESRLLLFLALLLCLVVVGSHASGAGEKYWHAVLPKTPFPKALQDLVEPNSESKTVVDKDNDGMVTDRRQNLEDLKDIDDDPLSSNGFSKIPKDASVAHEDSVPTEELSETTKDATIIYEKPGNPQKVNLQYEDSAPSKDLSGTTKDATIIYENSRNPKKMNLLHETTKDATIIYEKPRNPQKQANLQYEDSAPSKDLSGTTKDATIIYENSRNPKKMNLLHAVLLSSKGFSKIPKDASVAYEKPMHSQQTILHYDDSVPSEDLSEATKDITIVYGNSRNSQQRTLRYDNSAPSKCLSEMVKDLYIIYQKPRNSQKTSLLHEKPNDSEQILKDDIASSKDLLKFLKNLSAYLYTKSKNSQQVNLQYDDSALSQDMSETVKDISIIYDTPRSRSKMNLEFDGSASKKHFSKINQDSDLPQAKQPAKAASGDRTIFYKYNDLHPGKKMTLLFTNAGNKVDFLPRQVAEKIPFSSDKVPQILKRFSIDPDSADAEVIQDTIGDCESRQTMEVHKHCATSLESLVDQNFARLGRNIRVLSTPEGKKQEYTVLAGTKKIADDRIIVCHKERYPYAVYYCHEINDTEVYTVPLMGADGTKLRAVTICHKGTSAWNPDYIAFQILKMKPGQPFCHFLPSDALVWFQTKELGHDLMAYLQNISNQGAFDI